MREKCVVLFSGGKDSCLSTILALERFKEIHLIAYKRLGIFKTNRVLIIYRRFKELYQTSNLKIHFIKIDKFYKEICYENYLDNILKFRLKLLSVCGLCKLAMHWRTIIFCLENKIKNVYDGAHKSSEVFPAQNPDIMMKELKKLYSEFQITYSTPVYDVENVNLELYKKGFVHFNEKQDFGVQPLCIDNLLFSKFVEYYLGIHSKEKYIQELSEFYNEKINYVREKLKECFG